VISSGYTPQNQANIRPVRNAAAAAADALNAPATRSDDCPTPSPLWAERAYSIPCKFNEMRARRHAPATPAHQGARKSPAAQVAAITSSPRKLCERSISFLR
jgi:hypothetical protein